MYLKGTRFKLVVDHRPMETLSKIHTKTLSRLQQQLSEYNFLIEYRPGRDNQVADALSRNPVDEISAMGLTDDHLRELQRKDDFVRQYFALDNPQPHVKVVEDSYMARFKPYLDGSPDRLLYYVHRGQGGEQRRLLVLPQVLREEILKASHMGRFSGHGGREKTLDRIQEAY